MQTNQSPARIEPAASQQPLGWYADQLDLREILHTLLKYRWTVVLFVLLVLGATAAYTLHQPKIYRATTTLRIDLMSRNAMGEVWQFFVPSPGLSVNPDFYETHFKLLESPHVSEAVVENLPPELRERLGQDPAGALHGMVTIEPVKDTRLVRIHVDHTDPLLAEAIALQFADGYERHNLQNAVSSVRRASKWLARQLEESRSKVEDAEVALYEFKQRRRISTSSIDDRQSLLGATILQQNTMVAEAEAQRLRIEARRQQLRALRDSGDFGALALALEDTGLAELKKQHLDATRKRGSLLARYKDKHPEVLAATAEVARLSNDLEVEVERKMRSLEAKYETALGAEKRLTHSLEGSKRESLDLARHEIEFNRLLRQAENARQIHQLLLKRSKENALSDMEFDNNVRRVGNAIRDPEPIRPRTGLNALLGLLVGLLGGVGLAFFLGSVDNRIYTREDLERRSGLSQLGIFPTLRGGRRGKLWTGDRPFVESYSQSSAAECARILRTNMLFALGEGEPGRGRCIMITSPEPRAGKTTLSANLSVILAELGRRILLVEGDLRRPSVRRGFGVPRGVGIGDLADERTRFEDLPRPSGVTGLDLITAGQTLSNPSPLLESDRFGSFIEWARKHYDLVVIDAPPLLVVADPLLMVPRVDGVLVVGRSGGTLAESLSHARIQLEEIGAPILGGVINHVDMRRRENRYYYYYYHKYGEYYVRVKRRSDTRPDPPDPMDSASPPSPPA